MTVKCPECSKVISDGSIGWGYHGPCPTCKKWVDEWIEIDDTTGEPARGPQPETPSVVIKDGHVSETPPSFKTEYPSVDSGQEAFARIKTAYPVCNPAFVPDGKTSGPAIVAMILGAPVAWIGAAVCAVLAGGLAGLILGVFGKMILWFPSKIGFLRDFTVHTLDPLLMFLVKAAVIGVGGYVTAVIVAKIVSAFGRLGKNRSVEAAQAVSVIATAIVLGYTWYANMKYNPLFPELLRGGWGIAVGLLYAIGFAATGAEGAENAVKTKPFCQKCKQFTFVPRTIAVPASLMATTRAAVQSGLLQPLPPLQPNPKDGLGTLSWHECYGCGEGYLDLTVELTAKCGSEQSAVTLQDKWLTASAHLDGDEAKNAKAIFPPLPSATVAANAKAHTKPSGPQCPSCGTPYRLEDYDKKAPKIYCSTCKAELPKDR